MSKRLEKSTITLIETLYLEHGSAEKVSKITKITPKTVVKYLKQLGYDFSNKTIKITISYDEALKLWKNYNGSLTSFCKRYKMSMKHFSTFLKKHNIVVPNKHNEVKFNEHIFDTIDTEEKAYWLGFIYADGYISTQSKTKKPNYRFELSLKGEDSVHLYKFNSFVEHKYDNVKINQTKCGNKTFQRCRWSINNKHFWEMLNSYGCTPRKSLTLKFPDEKIFKSSDLIRHFIRGYFDGDGCISWSNKEHTKISFSLLGTQSFLQVCKEKLFSRGSIYQSSSNAFVYNSSNNIAFQNAFSIYHNANVYLERKYQKYLSSCRLYKKLYEELMGKIGERCDANTEAKD